MRIPFRHAIPPEKRARTALRRRCSGGWEYRTAYFQDFEGKYDRLQISVAKNADGNTVCNVGKIQERSSPAAGTSDQTTGALSPGSSAPEGGALSGEASGDNVPQDAANVKKKYRRIAGNGKHLLFPRRGRPGQLCSGGAAAAGSTGRPISRTLKGNTIGCVPQWLKTQTETLSAA